MRSLNKNKQKLMYSLQVHKDNQYVYDEDGNMVFEEVDGQVVPKTTSSDGYTVPEKFFGNIHSSGGAAEAQNYGVSTADYDAVLYTQKNAIELTETSLVWFENEPKFTDEDKTTVDPNSADYKVYRVPPCLDERVYLLKRVDK